MRIARYKEVEYTLLNSNGRFWYQTQTEPSVPKIASDYRAPIKNQKTSWSGHVRKEKPVTGEGRMFQPAWKIQLWEVESSETLHFDWTQTLKLTPWLRAGSNCPEPPSCPQSQRVNVDNYVIETLFSRQSKVGDGWTKLVVAYRNETTQRSHPGSRKHMTRNKHICNPILQLSSGMASRILLSNKYSNKLKIRKTYLNL